MNKIYFISDLHLCHNREFLFKPRGFDSIDDHNKCIISNWNSVIDDDDEVYILGDLMLNDNDTAIEYLKKLKGNKHIILGNHDTDARILLYKIFITADVKYADVIKYKANDGNTYRFYLSHYPTFTSNLEKEHISQCVINLYGHTHQKTNFYNDIPFMYHVGIDSHDNKPVEIEEIISDIKDKVLECKEML